MKMRKIIYISILFIPSLGIPLKCKPTPDNKPTKNEQAKAIVCQKKFLQFSAQDMNKGGNSPDTLFTPYAASSSNVPAWSMKKSSSTQQDITLMCALPADLDPLGALEVTVYFLVEKKADSNGSAAHMRVRADTKSPLQKLGRSFAYESRSGDFRIIEPTNNYVLQQSAVTIPLALTVQPKNMLLLVFDRVSTIDENEYSKDIYLTNVVVSYCAN